MHPTVFRLQKVLHRQRGGDRAMPGSLRCSWIVIILGLAPSSNAQTSSSPKLPMQGNVQAIGNLRGERDHTGLDEWAVVNSCPMFTMRGRGVR